MTEGPPLDQVDDQELAEALASQFMANDLRRWMSDNGLRRSRGANKMESARQAVQQDREGIAELLYQNNALDVDWERKCKHHEVCGNTTPGASTDLCDRCLDLFRMNDREADPIDASDYEERIDFVSALYERYD